MWCCRGGACLWMMALSLIRAPAAPDAHTHMLTFMRKHTLRINLLNLRPPRAPVTSLCFQQRLFPCLMPALFTLFSCRCFMSLPDLSCGHSLTFTQSATPAMMPDRLWYTATSLRLVDDATLNNNSTGVEADKSCRAPQC